MKKVGNLSADVHDCKVNTGLWWPFDDLGNCMHKRGYELVSEDEPAK